MWLSIIIHCTLYPHCTKVKQLPLIWGSRDTIVIQLWNIVHCILTVQKWYNCLNMRQQRAATAGIQLRVLSAGGRSFPICHLWPLNVKMMIVMSEMTKGRLVIRNLSLACQRVSILNSVVERFDGSTCVSGTYVGQQGFKSQGYRGVR